MIFANTKCNLNDSKERRYLLKSKIFGIILTVSLLSRIVNNTEYKADIL